jgi:hypothetical protein
MNWRKGDEVIENQLKNKAKPGELIPDVMRCQIILNTVCYEQRVAGHPRKLTLPVHILTGNFSF